MLIACGNDIILDSRINNILSSQSALNKVFHQSELKYGDTKKIAGIFSLKESCIKALNLTSKNWLDIEVKYSNSGKPYLNLSPEISININSIDCSISHENGYTITSVVALLKSKQ